MRRSIPVTIGYHSGVHLPDTVIEFKDPAIESRLVEAMRDGAEFTVGISAHKSEGRREFVIDEIRFNPMPATKKE